MVKATGLEVWSIRGQNCGGLVRFLILEVAPTSDALISDHVLCFLLLLGPDDKTPNHSSLNLLNFTKVALQTGKDSLRGLLLRSQVLQARRESQIRL